MAEFLDHQRRLAAAKRAKRTLADRSRDDRVWLDPSTFAAWTLNGELVAVGELDPVRSRWSPRLRRLTGDEWRRVFAADRLIPTVVALYPGEGAHCGQPVTVSPGGGPDPRPKAEIKQAACNEIDALTSQVQLLAGSSRAA